MHSDVITVGPWVISSQNAFDHARPPLSWLGQGYCVLRMHSGMDVIMVGPWMLSHQNSVDHGCHHGLPMDALCSKQNVMIPPPPPHPQEETKRRRSYPPSCFDIISFGPWMLWAQNAQ